jgi:hypothetical protein
LPFLRLFLQPLARAFPVLVDLAVLVALRRLARTGRNLQLIVPLRQCAVFLHRVEEVEAEAAEVVEEEAVAVVPAEAGSYHAEIKTTRVLQPIAISMTSSRLFKTS